MAILIPVVNSVRQSAIAGKCTSNIRQTAVALLAHVDDNGGRFMPNNFRAGSNMPSSLSGRIYWGRVLAAEGYVEDPHVLFCPLLDWGSQPDLEDILYDPSQPEIWPWAATYASSRTGLMPSPLGDPGKPAPIDSVAREGVTSAMIMLTECQLESRPELNGFAGFMVREGPDPRFHYRHNDSMNAAYVDGHVERLTRARVESFGVTWQAPWFTDVFIR